MSKVDGFCFDIESDGFLFESTKVWCIVFKDLNDPDKILKLNPFIDDKCNEKITDFIKTYDERPYVIGHNILGFDMFVIRCLMDIDFKVGKSNGDEFCGIPVQFVDTYYWSMYLFPDRVGHSIEAFGDRLGLEKIDFRKASIDEGIISKDSPLGEEFKQYSELMLEYCMRDVDVNILVFNSLLEEHNNLYGVGAEIESQSFKCGQKSFFLMSCQEYAGWKFDIPKAEKLLNRIGEMMEEIRAEVEPVLPPRGLKKSEQKAYTFPAKPYKKDGTFSAHMINFIDKHNGVVLDSGMVEFFGVEYPVIGGLQLDIKVPMLISNQEQIKEFLLEQGWVPTLYNFKRGPDGKPERDPLTRQLIKTSPKMQEQGKLCPNLEEMEGDLVKKIVKWLSLRNRQSVLRGWLEDPRLKYDGRLSPRRSGIAATHRQKHAVIVNVPKADPKVLLGFEFRELFICRDGYKISAGDAAAIEGRVQGHYAWKYDNGVTADELLKGDVHSKNAKAFYKKNPIVAAIDILADDFSKDSDVWKPFRNKSKNGFYAILYGAAAPKVASTLGIPESDGQEALEAFWEANPGTKQLKEAVESYWNTIGKKKYLPAIDGRILHTRKKSALLNTLFQSCGGIIMDYAGCFMDMWLGDIYFDEFRRPYYIYKGYKVSRIGYYHDELEYEPEDPIAEDVGVMIEKAIEKAGKFLGIKVPLAGEAKVGINWRETH